MIEVKLHYSDVIMGATASQITILTIVYSTIYSGADQRKFFHLMNSSWTRTNPRQRLSISVALFVQHELLVSVMSPYIVPHICITQLGHHLFRWWLVACSVPSHWLKKWWLPINHIPRKKLQRKLHVVPKLTNFYLRHCSASYGLQFAVISH